MADAAVNGGGNGSGRDDSDGGNQPKRPRNDEPIPEVDSSNEQPPAEGSADGSPQPESLKQQREPDSQTSGASGSVVKKTEMPRRAQFLWPAVWARMPQPGPLMDPYFWARGPHITFEEIERHHHACLVDFWERVIRHYRGIQPMNATAPPDNEAAPGEQEAPQLPPVQVNVPAAGPQEGEDEDAGQAIVAAPDEQAAPEVDGDGEKDGDLDGDGDVDGGGDDAEAGLHM